MPKTSSVIAPPSHLIARHHAAFVLVRFPVTVTFGTGMPHSVTILGLILMLIGFLLGIPILWTIGIILVVIGLILWILGATGREFAGRRHYW
jgi:hypothetical protein